MNFYGGGHIGDTLYQLYAIRSLVSRVNVGGAHFFLGEGQQENWDRRNRQDLLSIIRRQPYIRHCDHHIDQEIDHDFFATEWQRCQHHESINNWPSDANLKKIHYMGLMSKFFDYPSCLLNFSHEAPWIYPRMDHLGTYDIVFHARYRRLVRSIDEWKFILKALRGRGRRITIIQGPQDEGEWNDLDADYVKPRDISELVDIISRCSLFMGAASAPYVAAEGLGQFRMVEICQAAWGTRPRGDTGICVNGWSAERVIDEAGRFPCAVSMR